MKYYTKEAIERYALYNAVKLIDIDNRKHIGWLVPKDKGYAILPLNDTWNTYNFKRSHIKEIYHLTNGVLIPKEFKG